MKKNYLLLFIFIFILCFKFDSLAENARNFDDDLYDFFTYSDMHITLRDDKGRVTQGVFDGKSVGERHNTAEDNTWKYTIRGKYPYLLFYKEHDNDNKLYYGVRLYVDNYGEYDASSYKETPGYAPVLNETKYNFFTDIYIAYCYPDEISNNTMPSFFADDPDLSEKVRDYLENGVYTPDPDIPYEQPLEFDEDIELPQNFKCVSGYKYSFQKLYLMRIDRLSKDIVYTWNQTVDTSQYTYEVDVKFKYSNMERGQENDTEYITDWVNIGKYNYDGHKNITLTLRDSELNAIIKEDAESHGITQPLGYYPAGGISAILNVYVRVRNISNGKCSNYVNSDINITDKSVSNSETDSDDVTVEDAEYDNNDGTKDNSDGTKTDISNVTSLSDLTDVINYIKSGFNLFSSNGLVAFFKSFFGGMIPDSYWRLVTTGMAIVIFIGIINFILKR